MSMYDTFAKFVGVVAQNHLLEQFGKYLKVAHKLDERRAKEIKDITINEKPRDEDFIRKIKNSEGHCSGFTPLFLYSRWLQDQPREKGREHIERDDLEWLNRVLKRLAKWRGDVDKLTVKDGEDFDRLLNHLEYFQNIDNYMPSYGHGELAESLEDTKYRRIQREFALGGMFTLDDLISILPRIIMDERLMLITSHNHTVGIYKKGNTVYFYDSNKMFGEKEFDASDVKGLAKKMFGSLFADDKKPCPLAFRNFVMGEPSPDLYPAQHELLAKTEVVKAKKYAVNYQAEQADNYSSLCMAASIGDTDSVRIYLNNGADFRLATKKGNTALELAALGGYAATVDAILEHALSISPFELESRQTRNAITKAVNKGFNETIVVFINQFLIIKKIDSEMNYRDTLHQLITGAAKINDPALLVKLLQKGKNENMLDINELSDIPLGSIIQYCGPKTVMTFLQMLGTLFNETDCQKLFIKAFHEVCISDRADLVDVFFEAAPEWFNIKLNELLDMVGDNERNAFQYSISSKQGSKVMDVLVKHVEVEKMLDSLDQEKNNVLHLSMHRNGAKKIKFLCEQILLRSEQELQDKLMSKNSDERTPLHLAVLAGDQEEIMAIYNVCKKVNFKDSLSKKEITAKTEDEFFMNLLSAPGTYKNNVLHIAVNRGNVEIMDALLNIARQDSKLFNYLLTAQNEDGNTCFHAVFQKNIFNIDIIKALISRMDDSLIKEILNTTNSDGKTPLMLAQDKLGVNLNAANIEAVNYLRKEAERLGIRVQFTQTIEKSLKS